MRPGGDPYRAAPVAVWILASVLAGGADGGTWMDHQFSGRSSLETRWFPESAAHDGQRRHASGFAAAPRLSLADADGRSLTLAPFFRYDSADPRRTHADLREAGLLLFGEVGAGEWELRVGIDQVFWGVAESQHLVDIVNQVDFVEHPDGEAKLEAGPAHDPSHLVRRLGSPGVVRPALAPRPHLSRTGGPAASPPCRGGRAGRVRERSPGAAPGPRRPVQSRHRRRRYWSEPVRGHQPGALPAAGRGLRGRADPDPALRADPATGAGCPVDHRLLAVQARSDSARRRPQPQRTGRGLRRLRARRRVHVLFSAWHHGGSRPARRMELRWTGAQCDAEALAEHPGERPLSRRAPGLQRYAGHRGCRGDDWGRPTGNPHFGRGGEPADLRPLVPEPGGDSSYSASTKRISTTTRGRTASSTWTWSGACRLLPGSGGGVQGIGKAETHVFLDAVHRRDFQIGVLPQLVDQLVHQLFGR